MTKPPFLTQEQFDDFARLMREMTPEQRERAEKVFALVDALRAVAADPEASRLMREGMMNEQFAEENEAIDALNGEN